LYALQTFYAVIEQPGIAGIISSILVLASFNLVQHLKSAVPADILLKYALVVHAFSWAAQIFGHVVFEKRSPAFIHNLFQAFVMAPLFVVVEVLFMFGYRPEFKKHVDARIASEIKTA
jgi:2-hydroxy fatty acid dioxygenase